MASWRSSRQAAPSAAGSSSTFPSSPSPVPNTELEGDLFGRMDTFLASLQTPPSSPQSSIDGFGEPMDVEAPLPDIPMPQYVGFDERERVAGAADHLRHFLHHGGQLDMRHIDGGEYIGVGQAPEEYQETGAPRVRQTKKTPTDPLFRPYADRVACILDVLRHLPRSIFSDAQMETITWAQAALHVDNVPSVSWLKNMSDDLQDKIGIRTLRFQGALGHVYYSNSLQDQIAQEFGNPLISKHIGVYPADVEPGISLTDPHQFRRWRHDADPDILTPMLRMKNPISGAFEDFYVFEPAQLNAEGKNEICMPVRFFTREVSAGQTSTKEFFVEAWRLQPVVSDRPEGSGYVVLEHSSFEFPASWLLLSFIQLRSTYETLGVPNPGRILGRRIELGGELLGWSRTSDAQAGNNWRVKARGHRVATFMMWLYCDDTSGNSSKKWNKHNSFLWTAAGLPRAMAQQQQNVHFLCTSNLAPPLEMLDGIATQLEEGQRDGWWVWDYANSEPVLVIPEVLALLGDNPMQSELSCHIGLMGKYFCRICKVRGRDAADNEPRARPTVVSPLDIPQNEAHPAATVTSPLSDELDSASNPSSASTLAGSSVESSNASTSGLSGSATSAASDAAPSPTTTKPRKRPMETLQQLRDRAVRFLATNPLRHKDETQAQLRSIFTEASRVGGKTQAGHMQTEFGVKDTYQTSFMERIFEFGRKLRGSVPEKQAKMDAYIRDNIPNIVTSPVWRIKDLDPHKDTPVEILHVVLLGYVKYFWRDIISRLNADEKILLATRLSSFDVSGLGLSPLVGTTLVQYAGSLTGRDFRALAQAAPFVLYDLTSDECYDAWVALCRLIPLIWQPEIVDLDAHLSEMEEAIDYFLLCTAKWTPRWFNKPKFHLLRHLPAHIRRFGPAILFATEAFEAFNAVIRAQSVHSNRHAPSRDIARGLAQCNRVRHIFSGGVFAQRPEPADPTARSVADVLPPLFPGPEPPRAEQLQTAGEGCLALVHLGPGSGSRRNHLANELGILRQADPTPGLVSVPAKAKPVPWSSFHTLSKLSEPDTPPDTSNPMYLRCSDVILQNGEKAIVGSWALLGSLDRKGHPLQPLRIAQVVEIYQRLSSPAYLQGIPDQVMVQYSERTDDIIPGYLMYKLARREFELVDFKNLVCLVNVQHNCADNNCDMSGSAKLIQEREDTGRTVPRVKHHNPDDIMLNIAQQRSARYVGVFRAPVQPLELESSVMTGAEREIREQKAGKGKKKGGARRKKATQPAVPARKKPQPKSTAQKPKPGSTSRSKDGNTAARNGGRGGNTKGKGPRGAAAEKPTSSLAMEID
ncbi:unnamed protein product [Peniophora sp. CBMAI 1063]|nr:unnamed protein product [Peniophora sp. CBMAI 1063]